jgi:hypothetical protein
MPMPWRAIAAAMGSERPRRRAAAPALLVLLLPFVAALPNPLRAAEPGSAHTIFQCDVNGKRVTSDRLIAECVHKEQRELNVDGSLKRIVAPTLTSDELAAKEQKEQQEKLELAARNDAIRRDRNLMQRFPDEAVHRKAREKALDELRISVKNSDERVAVLLAEQKKLDEEKKFYVNDKVNKVLPAALKQKIDANDAALDAQKALVQNQQAEVGRINALYDVELGRLRKLWSGAQPGSLGPMPGPKAATTAKVDPG